MNRFALFLKIYNTYLPLGFLSAHVRPLGAFQDFSQILTAVLLRGFCPLSLPKTGLRKIVPEDAVVQVI